MKNGHHSSFLLLALAGGVWVTVYQNSVIMEELRRPQETRVKATSRDPIPVSVIGAVDVNSNLAKVAGFPLVYSKSGMIIGVASVSNQIIPIEWGRVELTQGQESIDVNIKEIGDKPFQASTLLTAPALPVRVEK